MISTILLPHADTRERLLAPGAPVAFRVGDVWHFGWTVACGGGRVGVYWPDLGAEPLVPDDTYLVLARDGAVVPEGVDRLARVLGWASSTVESLMGMMLAGLPTDLSPDGGSGTLVLLDAEGKEVPCV